MLERSKKCKIQAMSDVNVWKHQGMKLPRHLLQTKHCHGCCFISYSRFVQFLIEGKADISSANNKGLQTDGMFSRPNIEVVRILLWHACSIDFLNYCQIFIRFGWVRLSVVVVKEIFRNCWIKVRKRCKSWTLCASPSLVPDMHLPFHEHPLQRGLHLWDVPSDA